MVFLNKNAFSNMFKNQKEIKVNKTIPIDFFFLYVANVVKTIRYMRCYHVAYACI